MTEANVTPKIRILIADDHPLLREGVAAVIDLQHDMAIVGQAENGAQAVEMFSKIRPDVCLIDLQMPVLDGVEAITRIRAIQPAARIIVLTTYSGDAMAMRALKAGAAGYLLKSTLRKELIDTIRSVHAGRKHLHTEVANELALHAIDEALTPREIGVLRLVSIGKANKEIAWELGVSEDTVKAHLKATFGKLDVSDRTHAVTVAARRGIIEL